MTEHEEHEQLKEIIDREHEPGPDQDLRYTIEPAETLKECQKCFASIDSGYRWYLYERIATVYAIALRTLKGKEAMARLQEDEDWRRSAKWKIRDRRDFFREVAKFVTRKLSSVNIEDTGPFSKYAKVMWHLDNDKVGPEMAASAIYTSRGIEKVAQNGLYKEKYMDPRDVGDGMTPTGEKIHYPDEEEEKIRRGIVMENRDELTEALLDPEVSGAGQVHIEARCWETRTGRPVLSIVSVRPKGSSDGERSSDGMEDDGEPYDEMHRLKVEILGARYKRLLRTTPPGGKAVVILKRVDDGSDRFTATRLARWKPSKRPRAPIAFEPE